MKYLITENKLYSIIDKIISQKYGAPLIMVRRDENDGHDPEYLYFFGINQNQENFNSDDYNDYDDTDYPPFSRNSWGMLFNQDVELYGNIKNLLGIDRVECNDILANYFRDKYDIYIKGIRDSF